MDANRVVLPAAAVAAGVLAYITWHNKRYGAARANPLESWIIARAGRRELNKLISALESAESGTGR